MSVARKAMGRILRVGSSMLLLLFAIGYISAYLPPSWFWWTGLPASLLPFIAAGMAGVLLVHGALGHWWWAGLHIVALLFFVGRAGLPAGDDAQGTPPTDPATLTVMSFNYTPFDGTSESEPVLRGALGHLAAAYTPDIIAMQSTRVFQRRGGVALINQLDTLKSVGYEAEPQHGFGARFDTRVPLFSRPEAPDHQEPIVLAAQSGTDRHVTRSEISWDGNDIVIYNVHLRSFERGYALDLLEAGRYRAALRELVAVYRRDVLQRTQEARELRQLLEAETAPTLLIGDLNASPFNWEYRHVRGSMHDAPAQLGGNWRFTWHTQLPLARIDHVLTSDHWTPVSMQIDTTTISDHYPLVVGLRLRNDE